LRSRAVADIRVQRVALGAIDDVLEWEEAKRTVLGRPSRGARGAQLCVARPRDSEAQRDGPWHLDQRPVEADEPPILVYEDTALAEEDEDQDPMAGTGMTEVGILMAAAAPQSAELAVVPDDVQQDGQRRPVSAAPTRRSSTLSRPAARPASAVSLARACDRTRPVSGKARRLRPATAGSSRPTTAGTARPTTAGTGRAMSPESSRPETPSRLWSAQPAARCESGDGERDEAEVAGEPVLKFEPAADPHVFTDRETVGALSDSRARARAGRDAFTAGFVATAGLRRSLSSADPVLSLIPLQQMRWMPTTETPRRWKKSRSKW